MPEMSPTRKYIIALIIGSTLAFYALYMGSYVAYTTAIELAQSPPGSELETAFEAIFTYGSLWLLPKIAFFEPLFVVWVSEQDKKKSTKRKIYS